MIPINDFGNLFSLRKAYNKLLKQFGLLQGEVKLPLLLLQQVFLHGGLFYECDQRRNFPFQIRKFIDYDDFVMLQHTGTRFKIPFLIADFIAHGQKQGF